MKKLILLLLFIGCNFTPSKQKVDNIEEIELNEISISDRFYNDCLINFKQGITDDIDASEYSYIMNSESYSKMLEKRKLITLDDIESDCNCLSNDIVNLTDEEKRYTIKDFFPEKSENEIEIMLSNPNNIFYDLYNPALKSSDEGYYDFAPLAIKFISIINSKRKNSENTNSCYVEFLNRYSYSAMDDKYILIETVDAIENMRNEMSEERFNEFKQNVDLFGLWKCVIIKYASKYSYTEFNEIFYSDSAENNLFSDATMESCFEENLKK